MGVPLFGQQHVDRYRETDGEQGHDWQGTTVLNGQLKPSEQVSARLDPTRPSERNESTDLNG
jgi:hypothetical protein